MKKIKLIVAAIFTLTLIISNAVRETNPELRTAKKENYYSLEKTDQHPEEVLKLDLTGHGLKQVPEEVKSLCYLQELILDNNQLTAVPEWIRELKHLKKISLYGNPTLDVYRLAANIEGMSQLEELNLSDCNISALPYQFSNLYGLKKLDVSENNIPEVPFHISFLTKLESLNLSGNQIEDFGFVFSNLPNLKSLDLRDNPRLNVSLLGENLGLKNMEFLAVDDLNHLKDHYDGAKIEELIIEHPSMEEFPQGMDVSSLEKLTLYEPKEKFKADQVLSALDGSANLKELRIRGVEKNSLAKHIAALPSLEVLDLSGNNLSDVSFLHSRKNLKKIILRGNDIDKDKIKLLKKALPKCEVEADTTEPAPYNFSIAPPIMGFCVPQVSKTLNPKFPDTIRAENTTLFIPANAFVDEKGKVVKEPVKVTLREYCDPVDIAISGIPMKIKTGDSLSDFGSAGMIDVRATSNNKPVYPNPDNLITAQIGSTQTSPDFNLYKLSDTTSQWNTLQNSVNIAGSSNLPLPNLSFPLTRIEYGGRPSLGYSKIGLRTKRNNVARGIELEFTFLEMSNSKPGMNEVHQTTFAPLFNHYTLIYNGDNPGEDRKLLDSIGRQAKKAYRHSRHKKTGFLSLFAGKTGFEYDYNECSMIKDIKLTPSLETDDYILSFNSNGNSYGFHVYPLVKGSTPEAVQDKNKRFYIDYVKCREDYKKDEKTAYEGYRDQVAKLEKSRKKQDISQVRGAQISNTETKQITSAIEGNTAYIARNFPITSFGIYNIDRIWKQDQPTPVLAETVTEDGNKQEYLAFMLLDLTDNAIMTYACGSDIIYDRTSENSAIVIIDKNRIGVITAEEFKKNACKSKMVLKIIDTAEAKEGDLKRMIIGGVPA